jgi:sialidase-1
MNIQKSILRVLVAFAVTMSASSPISLYALSDGTHNRVEDTPQTTADTLSQDVSGENNTSFESNTAGPFAVATQAKTNVGIWGSSKGMVQIDNKHAKSGSQCLQIAGDNSSVVLNIAEGIETDGELSFWAERWTARAPFQFRIEKKSAGEWTEVFNGDEEVRVGRAFLSHIKIPLNDSGISQLRFTVTSPPETGILIDDLKIAPARPQEITGIEVVPFALPALSGTDSSALVKLRVTTEGTLDPISIRKIKASIVGTSSDLSIKEFRPFFSGNESNFRWNQPFAGPRTPRQGSTYVFTGEQTLLEGENYLWLGCQLKPTTDLNIDETISGSIDSITFSNGETKLIESEPSVQRMGVAIRNRGDDGVHTYRIPGLATTNSGTLIGVYDIRHDSGGDLPGNIDVGMSRSTDGGRNWEPMKVIMDMGDDPKWRGDGIGDPSVLVDRKTGTIWVSATWSHGNRSWVGSGPGLEPQETGQWILVKSDDDGVTWSKPINITKQVKNPEWSFLLQGPGKGITMSDGTIVFPAQYQDPPNANRLPHSTFIYSRDHGATWEIATGAWDDTTESQIVELADGKLMLNCRNNRASKRAIMTTNDMGATWKEHSTHVKDLIEPGSCMASLINVGRELAWRNIKSDYHNDFLLFSNPDSLRGRNHMTIKASLDSGATWSADQQLLLDEQGGAGYSCLTMIDSETVGILYEGSQAHMTFQRIKIKDILNPPENQKVKNPAFTRAVRNQPDTFASRPERNLPTQLSLARPFGDHMVIQVNQPIRIWGNAKPNVQVNADFLDQSKSTQADEKGNWQLAFSSHNEYERSGKELIVSAGSERIVLQNILVGEVWFCAGQSNMEWELRKSTQGKLAIANSDDPLLRLHNCPGGARGGSGTYDESRMRRLWPEDFSQGHWQVASQDSASSFSAVGYYFAKRLREKLDVPVGLINVSVGGTPIEAWVSVDRLKSAQGLAKMLDGNWLENPMLDAWCQDRARENLKLGLTDQLPVPGDSLGPNHSFKPGFMYEAAIKPFSPLAIRGVLWYQGESNGDTPARTQVYDQCFPLLVDEWRTQFTSEDLPIVFVQLPAMGRPNWPVFREYQRRSLTRLTNVGMAITIDTGHPTNVHPTDKQPVGNRLAQWALVNTYGQNGTANGPLFETHQVNGGTIQVTFSFAGKGLATSDGLPPNQFEIAGDDGIFKPANAEVAKNLILLKSDDVPRPVHVRYAWSAFPKPTPNLINSDGLPASPFTSQQSFHSDS